jgi:hypothetical protein
MNPKANPLPGEQGAAQTTADEAMSRFIVPDDLGRFIARGSAGDCCILCGKVGIHLPLDHGCRPNIDVQAYRNRRRLVSDWGQRPQAPIAAHYRRAA